MDNMVRIWRGKLGGDCAILTVGRREPSTRSYTSVESYLLRSLADVQRLSPLLSLIITYFVVLDVTPSHGLYPKTVLLGAEQCQETSTEAGGEAE